MPLGLTSIIQNGRERFLLPNSEVKIAKLLPKLLVQFPPLKETSPLVKKQDREIGNPTNSNTELGETGLIDVREWVIEPETGELTALKVRSSLFST